MTDLTPDPATRVTIEINGMDWDLVPTNKLGFPEAKEIKKLTDGMGLVDLENGLQRADGDAWFAWIYISVKRAWPTLTVAELEKAFEGQSLVDIIEKVKDNTPEGMEPFGAAAASESDSLESPPEGSSSEPTLPPSTPETSGTQL